jgi:hypothetical protein
MTYKLKYRQDDVDLLLPTFRASVVRVVARMQALGFEPVVFDTLRTLEEAARNAAKGTGILNSLHLYGAACDVICNVHGWTCNAKRCKFYTVLRRVALAEGCCIGPAGDLPHFQAIPVGAWQNRLRAHGTSTATLGDRDRVVQAYRATLVKPPAA